MNNLFLITLTERDKKFLAVLAIIFVLAFIIIGALYLWERERMRKKGEKIYEYLYELNKYKVIGTPQELVECVRHKEGRYLYKNTRWVMRLLFISLAVVIFYFVNYQNGNFKLMIDSLKSLSFKLKWPTVNFWGLNVVSGLPSVIKYPEPILELYGYITYVFTVIVFIWLIVVTKAILNYIGRIDFAKTVAKEKFFRSLENPNDTPNLD